MCNANSYNADGEVDEQLVAYLDGELDAESALDVERRLAEDASFRRDLQQLQGVWDALDELPKSEVDESFTQTTVEMVVLSTEQAIEQQRHSEARKKRSWWLLAGGALVGMALASFWLTRLMLERPNQQLMRDLPVIEDIELYRVADSVEYLHLLEESGLFNDEEVGDAL
ncbi:MAG: anti-sigma factor family protein [Planctomycetota bacterium]